MDTVPVRDMSPRSPRLATPDSGWDDDDDDLDLGLGNKIYYIHLEITGYPCNLIGSQQCDLFLNRSIFCSKSHLSQIASFMF